MPGSVVDYVVQQGKKELARHRVRVDGDQVTNADDAGDAEAAVTFTLTPPLADAVANGSLRLDVGFMRGDVKMAGDFGALLRVLPVLARSPGL